MPIGEVNPNPAGVELNFPYPAPAASDLAAVAAATNAAATVAIPGSATQPTFVSQVEWSYSGTPVGGNVKLSATTMGTLRDFDIVAGGPGLLTFSPPLEIIPGAAVTLALAAGGTTSVTGKCAIVAWRLK